MLHFLSSKGIYVSSGSACSSHSNAVSSALTAFGLDNKDADSSIRVSLCPENTREEADIFVSALLDGIKSLQRK
jgi:cysteine desulfurase